ncbi:hypothetical protein [Qipengyuania vesicularis]|uniref:hypothetical protein n=1 Tax=Qipengyuania vesicularis TaxID=2867232 RepID=UPI001C87F3DC|nr:hypothetical protein [Qipengyuania vesicularis]MBX7526628.1 hypothetical protein [Qipengyuania vesicularis]
MSNITERGSEGAVQNNAKGSANRKGERRQYTLKGVEQEAVDLMRLAADAKGMKIGHWVSDRIKDAAKKALTENEKQRELLQGVVGEERDTSCLRTLSFSESGMSPAEMEERLRRVELEIQDLLKQQRDIFALMAQKAMS